MNVGARSITQANASQHNIIKRGRADTANPVIRVNVAGSTFYLHESDLSLHPHSLLANVTERGRFYEKSINCLFFDRNRVVFEYIVTFYQTGKMNFPKELDRRLIETELAFWRLHHGAGDGNTETVRKIPDSFKSRLHLLLVDPSSSRLAGIWAGTDVVMIALGLFLYCLETEPSLVHQFRDPAAEHYCYIKWTEGGITLFFTVDLFLRCISWPNLGVFCREAQNIIDFISLVPFYLHHIMETLDFIKTGRMLRMFRILRIIKLFRYFSDMFMILQFVYGAWQELVLVCMLTAMLLVMFGSVMYYVEGNKHFFSIMQGFWWSMVTITTVGYGDIYPITPAGQIAGSLLMVISMVVLTLPMTVVVTKFNYAYECDKRSSRKIEIVDSIDTTSLDSEQDSFVEVKVTDKKRNGAWEA